ncbi:cytochrome c biogenesis protein CcdA [Bdellovibrionota bacterium FG-1]
MTDFLSKLLSPETGTLTLGQTFIALGLAYVGGILASLTPCVYPMIPITVSVVGGFGRAKKYRLSEVWLRGLAYVGGMTVIYSFLGVLAGLTGRVFGSFTNTPGWYLSLGIIMTLAALMMLDIIPFDPQVGWEGIKRRFGKPTPHHHHPHNDAHEKEATLIGAFTLGASSGFIAAPCTTPVLTSILAYIAKTQSIGLGLGLMFFFSLGLGTILLIIAGFAGAMTVLPRSGQWMKTIKMFSGFLLLGFAEYLIYIAGTHGGL